LVASDLIPSSDPRHWVAKIWASVVARKQRAMLPMLERALSAFPSHEELRTVGVWVYSATETDWAEYCRTVEPLHRTARVLDAMARVAKTKSDWVTTIQVCDEILSRYDSGNVYARVSRARAQIELLEVGKYYGGVRPQSVKDALVFSKNELEEIWSNRKHEVNSDHNDLQLQAGLYLIDCYTFFEDAEAAEQLCDEVSAEYHRHWAAQRAQYLMWMNFGSEERALSRMRRLIDKTNGGDGFATI